MGKATVVATVRRWMEDEVMGRGFCPPLVKLAQGFRAADGTLDWKKLGHHVVVDDLTALASGPEALLDRVSALHLDFMVAALDGRAPVTRLMVLPDFADNAAFDAFIRMVKQVGAWSLSSNEKGRAFALDAFQAFAPARGLDAAAVGEALVRVDRDDFIAKYVVEGHFNLVQFYGRRVEDRDLVGVSPERGAVERYRVIARAPHYMLQVIHPLEGMRLTGNLNRPAVHARNTALALSLDPDAYERAITAFRPPRRSR